MYKLYYILVLILATVHWLHSSKPLFSALAHKPSVMKQHYYSP